MAYYDCYVVRVWRSAGQHRAQWSGRLEHLQDGEVLRFGTPQALLSQLQRLIEDSPSDTDRSQVEGFRLRTAFTTEPT